MRYIAMMAMQPQATDRWAGSLVLLSVGLGIEIALGGLIILENSNTSVPAFGLLPGVCVPTDNPDQGPSWTMT